MTFGRGSTGGVVNQATKTPAHGPASSPGRLDFGTDSTRAGHADINLPIPHSAAARLPPECDGRRTRWPAATLAENRRFGVAPSLALGIGTATRWTL